MGNKKKIIDDVHSKYSALLALLSGETISAERENLKSVFLPERGTAPVPHWGPRQPPEPSPPWGASGPQCRLLSLILRLLQMILTTLQILRRHECTQEHAPVMERQRTIGRLEPISEMSFKRFDQRKNVGVWIAMRKVMFDFLYWKKRETEIVILSKTQLFIWKEISRHRAKGPPNKQWYISAEVRRNRSWKVTFSAKVDNLSTIWRLS